MLLARPGIALVVTMFFTACGLIGRGTHVAHEHERLSAYDAPQADLASQCSVAAAQAAAPPGMRIGPISTLNPQLPPVSMGALVVPAEGDAPAYCLVTGTVVTNEARGKTASFGAALPLRWNNRLLFTGCGGLCGEVFNIPPNDQRGGGSPPDALARGYAIVATDDGHASMPPGTEIDGSWALDAPGDPDEEALTDFFYRAVHTVAVAGKQFVQRWYEGALARTYFYGCSDGGREGMVEAIRYPDDFDGYILGAPFLDVPGGILGGHAARVLLDAPDSYIPPELLAHVDRTVYERCDNFDGMADGLIQNPARCAFRPESLACSQHARTDGCLSRNQVNTLRSWLSATTDANGRVVSFGYSVSDIYNANVQGPSLFLWAQGTGAPRTLDAAQPWGNQLRHQPFGWGFYDQSFRHLVFRDPTHDCNRNSPVDERGVVDEAAMVLLETRTHDGNADDPTQLGPFLASGSKMILYHGYSDGFLAPFRTMRFYEDWANVVGGYETLRTSARLFMVPGMYHCHNGTGPNFIDALGALERWVERGEAPEQLVATKFTNDDRTQPVQRTMPVCLYPTQTTYLGAGDVNVASSWSCDENTALLERGENGVRAGLSRALR